MGTERNVSLEDTGGEYERECVGVWVCVWGGARAHCVVEGE